MTTAPLVLGVVGTDHHQFDRLVRWLDTWATTTRRVVRVLVQSGTSRTAAGVSCRADLTVDEMAAAVTEAAVVVCHGGPATIMEACHAGHLPLVVPRDPALGEHVDAHQLRFASWMAERERIVSIGSEEDLHRELEPALPNPPVRDCETPTVALDVSQRFGALVDKLVGFSRTGVRELDAPGTARPTA